MSSIKIIAGDLDKGEYRLNHQFMKTFFLYRHYPNFSQTIELDRIEVQSEESVKKLAGTAGWTLAGAALLGPIGAIGGLLFGGRSKETCFAAYLKDGRKFLATIDSKDYQKIFAAMF